MNVMNRPIVRGMAPKRTGMKRAGVALTALMLLSGCGIFGGGKDKGPKTPVVGERIPILVAETGAELDPGLAGTPVLLPSEVVNDTWGQPGGNAAKSMGHLGLGARPARIWSVSIGSGSSKKARLAAGPVIAGGRVYTIDTEATVRAFSADTGRQVWSTRVGGGENSNALFGGGVSVDGERLYATNGLGEVAALNASDGSQIWKKRPGGPLRGAPTVANEAIYVVSQDNQMFALKASDGEQLWTGAGTLESAGVFGMAAPAAAQGTVVAGFSSGELNAYRYENGRVVWQDALSRTSISTAVASLSDIDAAPVVDQGYVFAVGQGGRMVALELFTGQRLWELNVAGISTPWVAGDWVFVITDDARLLCIQRTTGRIRWIAQLDRWRDEKDKKGPISWTGPILAGNRLVAANSRGELVNVNPVDGSVAERVKNGGGIFVTPAVANNTLYVVDDDGKLSAWR